MIHPTVPCPVELKPLFAKLLRYVEDNMQGQSNLYLCHIALNVLDIEEATAVRAFIKECVGSVYDNWLLYNDNTYRNLPQGGYKNGCAEYKHANESRLAWLKFLVK